MYTPYHTNTFLNYLFCVSQRECRLQVEQAYSTRAVAHKESLLTVVIDLSQRRRVFSFNIPVFDHNHDHNQLTPLAVSTDFQ